MPDASRERARIETFLSALEKRIVQLADTMATASDSVAAGDGTPSFADYVHSRDLSSECWAFSIVIERHIELYSGADKAELRDRFEQLTVNIWSMLLQCSLHFLQALAQREHLPLGSREVFVREIKTLYDAHRLLSDPRYAHRIDDDLRRRHRQAERILHEIIDRAPALLNLGP